MERADLNNKWAAIAGPGSFGLSLRMLPPCHSVFMLSVFVRERSRPRHASVWQRLALLRGANPICSVGHHEEVGLVSPLCRSRVSYKFSSDFFWVLCSPLLLSPKNLGMSAAEIALAGNEDLISVNQVPLLPACSMCICLTSLVRSVLLLVGHAWHPSAKAGGGWQVCLAAGRCCAV